MACPFRSVAVPSWIVPGTAADSSRLLRALPSLQTAGWQVSEIGLCCFEGQSSLDAPLNDYPPLSDLAHPCGDPLGLHVHLPLNLDWNSQHPADVAVALMRKFSPLGVARAVLHPPPRGARLAMLQRFVDDWQAAGFPVADILLENDAYYTAPDFLALLNTLPVRVCVDVAHVMAYGQEALLTELDPDRVGLLHWSAPGPVPGKDAHKPLTELGPEQLVTARVAAGRFAGALPLVEVFDWNGVCVSLPVLSDLYGF